MFSGHPSVRPSVIHVVVLFPRYLQYLLTDFRQTFVSGASWDTDDLITFLGSKGQRSRSHHRGGGAQHSTLPSSATFSSSSWEQFPSLVENPRKSRNFKSESWKFLGKCWNPDLSPEISVFVVS